MAKSNPIWGEERIAAELLLKLRIRVSPRTVRRYMPTGSRPGLSSQRWMIFVRNHAQAMLASDFLVVVTARFRVLYVFVIMEVGTRRIAHFNVTAHPTAGWTLQQFREVVTGEQSQRFVIHDRDSIYSTELDAALESMDLRILRTPFRAPQAKAYVSYCTSLEHSGIRVAVGRRRESFLPSAFRGWSGPGGSYRHSGLSVYA